MNSSGKIVIVGFGNLGQGLIPLLHRHFPNREIIAIEQQVDAQRAQLAVQMGIRLFECRVTETNFERTLRPLLRADDFLLNLAPEVSSRALLGLAQSRDAFYLDTGIEPWKYAHGDLSATSNYALREQMLEWRRVSRHSRTALIAHGANPGFVSILVKHALLEMADKVGCANWCRRIPTRRDEWAELAAALEIRVIQISERDTQRADIARVAREFVNTWSVEGFVTECQQPAELGWGTHERRVPGGARVHQTGSRAAIELAQRGYETVVKTWTPLHGEFPAYVLTHNEAISIADYLTVGDSHRPAYRPTVYYAYRPTVATLESMQLLDGDRAPHVAQRVLKAEIVEGIDELGVLLMSGNGTSLWFGSALSIERTRALAPGNNATSLQVVSSIVAGMQWMAAHPAAGVVESDEIDHASAFASACHYWAPIQRVFTPWRPDQNKAQLQFDEFIVRDEARDEVRCDFSVAQPEQIF
ncbi:saccharopine dehydrogenase NADP-binding domain-containing protein [Paraburkholderia sp. MMS20-SJTR3]|uniref:Saccharopine dehydrogenase NADP-binding domain-containing protein n=1 Tax=Paraburkholderia sejongensis TaxID=2886946 RepID=A0ABS8K0X4_9BURK|nr:saccharopine dehydrogenase C-terminal domain-containing protein [Paraburkholderia sp. MMS20-SJTR3]MCC8395792.1 saccharopine dehydrogenase NADP-binding domain-containing protein [Paraburkholderia sp. MMS20-SJTR3]